MALGGSNTGSRRFVASFVRNFAPRGAEVMHLREALSYNDTGKLLRRELCG